MPYAIFDYMGAFLRSSFAHVDNVIPVIKTITWLLTTPELSGTFRTLPPEPTPTRARTLQNPPEPSGSCLRNLHQHTPEPSGTLRNLPEPASGTYTSTHRNSPEPSGTLRNPPEPSGTCLRNLPPEPTHHFIPELSETFRNFPPEPAPATCSGTHRSLSGLKTPLALLGKNKKTWLVILP